MIHNIGLPKFPEHVHHTDQTPVRGALPVAEVLALIARTARLHGAPVNIAINDGPVARTISLTFEYGETAQATAWAKAFYLAPARTSLRDGASRGWHGSIGLRFGWSITIRCAVDAP